jgi:predicted enzyme related to lactoylglutathione lyase
MNSPEYFEIQADEPAQLVKFYELVFGWKGTRDENIPIEYWRLETPGAHGAILKRPMPAKSGGTNAYVCSMQVASFDKTAEVILANGGIVAMAKFAVPGKCWQGYFLDPAGNTFGIFEVDEKAA